MKLLLFGLGNLYGIGGVQLSYSWLLNHLAEKGFEIRFFTHKKRPEGGQLYYQFPASVEIFHYDLIDTKQNRNFIRQSTCEYDPDVVLVVNSSHFSSIILYALQGTNYPVVLSERGGARFLLEHTWDNRIQRQMTHFLADFSHMLTPSYRQALPWFMRAQISIIPSVTMPANMLTDASKPNSSGRYVVLYTGRFAFEKDLNLLIEAFANLSQKFHNWDMKLIGAGPEEEKLKKQITALDLEGRIELLPYKAEISEVYQEYLKAHLYILPSRAEGCPLSLREAMAHGLPVIGFHNASGVNEIIEHQKTGLLVDGTEDQKIPNLTTGMETLMSQDQLRRAYGQAAAKAVRKYAPDIIHGKWEQLLRKAASLKGIKKKWHHFIKCWRYPIHSILMTAMIHRMNQKDSLLNQYHYRVSLTDFFLKCCYAKKYALLYGSVLFDPRFYLSHNYPLKKHNKDPLLHYILKGAKQGQMPSKHFNCNYYRKQKAHIAPGQELFDFYAKGYLENVKPARKMPPVVQKRLACELEALRITPCKTDFWSCLKFVIAHCKNEWKRIE